jgi:hypothetical protein
MSDAAKRVVVGILALAVGVAAGWFAHLKLAPAAPGAAAGVQIVHVDASGAARPDSVTIEGDDQILWVGPGTKSLTIESEQEIFQTQTPQHGRYAMSCIRHYCMSDAIKPGTPPGRYKYWQLLSAPNQPDTVVDGWIIIDR